VFETNVMPPGAALRTPERIRKQLWSELIGGVRGMFIFCMGDDREHGLLSDASVAPACRAEYTRFMQTVNQYGSILALPNEPASVAVVYSTSSTLQYPNSPNWPGSFVAAYSLVRGTQYNVDILPEEKCDLKSLRAYKVIVIPSYTILPEESLKALDEFVKNDGKILAFGHSLERDENFMPYETLPQCLGLKTREKPVGNREQLRLIVQDKDLQRYITDEFDITGAEKITAFKEQSDRLVMGQGLTVTDAVEKVLALNNDSYPSMITTRRGHVVYCAFDARNTEPMRRLVEGTIREEFKVNQAVRFVTEEGSTYAPVMFRLIRDTSGNRVYILVQNTGGATQTLSIETTLKPVRELFHSEKDVTKKILVVKPYEVYLIETE
jgi:beta-galactosidase